MKLERVEIENYRAIEKLELPLDPSLTVLHGANGDGKTSVLSAIAAGLGGILASLPRMSMPRFAKSDTRDNSPLRISLSASNEISWERRVVNQRLRNDTFALKSDMEKILRADEEGGDPLDLPIVAFYDTDRTVVDVPPSAREFRKEFSRYLALEGALSAHTDFKGFFEWFFARENEELREQRYREDFGFRNEELEAVRRAIASMTSRISRVSQPHFLYHPLRFVVTIDMGGGKSEKLALDQLSGGYRIVLALAADLARRMAQGNPHLDDPLESEAVVLIDEVDLHLHPAWQQRVLPDLMRTFPNAQFIVSTHSPQVLTTVEPERIVRLYRHDGRIRAGHESGPTYGAEAGSVLEAVMEVRQRPEGNEFVETLKKYMGLVDEGKGECAEARALRRDLEALSPEDYGLYRADAEMRRQRVMDRLGKPR